MKRKTVNVGMVMVNVPDGMEDVVDVDGLAKKKLAGLQHDVDEALAYFIMTSILDNANAYKAKHVGCPSTCYMTHEQFTLLSRSHVAPRSLMYGEGNHDPRIHGMRVELIPHAKKPLEVGE